MEPERFGEAQRPAFEAIPQPFPGCGGASSSRPTVKRNSGDDKPTRARVFRGA